MPLFSTSSLALEFFGIGAIELREDKQAFGGDFFRAGFFVKWT